MRRDTCILGSRGLLPQARGEVFVAEIRCHLVQSVEHEKYTAGLHLPIDPAGWHECGSVSARGCLFDQLWAKRKTARVELTHAHQQRDGLLARHDQFLFNCGDFQLKPFQKCRFSGPGHSDEYVPLRVSDLVEGWNDTAAGAR